MDVRETPPPAGLGDQAQGGADQVGGAPQHEFPREPPRAGGQRPVQEKDPGEGARGVPIPRCQGGVPGPNRGDRGRPVEEYHREVQVAARSRLAALAEDIREG